MINLVRLVIENIKVRLAERRARNDELYVSFSKLNAENLDKLKDGNYVSFGE